MLIRFHVIIIKIIESSWIIVENKLKVVIQALRKEDLNYDIIDCSRGNRYGYIDIQFSRYDAGTWYSVRVCVCIDSSCTIFLVKRRGAHAARKSCFTQFLPVHQNLCLSLVLSVGQIHSPRMMTHSLEKCSLPVIFVRYIRHCLLAWLLSHYLRIPDLFLTLSSSPSHIRASGSTLPCLDCECRSGPEISAHSFLSVTKHFLLVGALNMILAIALILAVALSHFALKYLLVCLSR